MGGDGAKGRKHGMAQLLTTQPERHGRWTLAPRKSGAARDSVVNSGRTALNHDVRERFRGSRPAARAGPHLVRHAYCTLSDGTCPVLSPGVRCVVVDGPRAPASQTGDLASRVGVGESDSPRRRREDIRYSSHTFHFTPPSLSCVLLHAATRMCRSAAPMYLHSFSSRSLEPRTPTSGAPAWARSRMFASHGWLQADGFKQTSAACFVERDTSTLA